MLSLCADEALGWQRSGKTVVRPVCGNQHPMPKSPSARRAAFCGLFAGPEKARSKPKVQHCTQRKQRSQTGKCLRKGERSQKKRTCQNFFDRYVFFNRKRFVARWLCVFVQTMHDTEAHIPSLAVRWRHRSLNTAIKGLNYASFAASATNS